MVGLENSMIIPGVLLIEEVLNLLLLRNVRIIITANLILYVVCVVKICLIV